MGLFNRSSNKIHEKTYVENGYVIGVDTHMIYHAPKMASGSVYVLPNGTTGIDEQALFDMRSSMPEQIIVPGSFKNFTMEFMNFQSLKKVILQEGIEEVKCTISNNKNAIDFDLPSTIKKIGKGNYPIVQHLTIPDGVTEIANLFASHDTNLISVNVPGTIKKVSDAAFNQCRNLESVVFNEGVESSGKDVFRGTNKLRFLQIPSTYNGSIDFSMDPRPVSNLRGNSKYDATNFAQEENNILCIKIKRNQKDFEFNIRRGDRPNITVNNNEIIFKCSNNSQVISVDCNSLSSGVYSINNKGIKLEQEKQEQQKLNEYDIMFEKSFKKYIDEEDFYNEEIYDESDMILVMNYMKQAFMNNVSHKIMRTDEIMFKRLFMNAINKLKQEKKLSPEQIDSNKNNQKDKSIH